MIHFFILCVIFSMLTWHKLTNNCLGAPRYHDKIKAVQFGEKYHRDNGIFLIASYQMAHKSDMPFYGDMNFDFSRIC